MRIRLEIIGTEPRAKDGTYVYDSGDVEGTSVAQVLDEVGAFLLRSFNELRTMFFEVKH